MVKPRALLPLLSLLAFLSIQGTASAAFFDNTSPIKINQRGPAAPSPSKITVAGQQGPIKDIKVTLFDLGHTAPGHLDILLVGPSGESSILMSDTCDLQGVEDRRWTFVSNPSPSTTAMGSNCVDGGYRPTDVSDGQPDTWPGAPAGPHTADLSNFEGLDPNGEWSLYVMDDGDGFEGDIETGWVITLETADSQIKIPAAGTSGPADPYPAKQTVSGQTGVVADVNVAVPGVFHQRPDDIDALLVGPRGQKVMLASDACGDDFPPVAVWLFDDGAPDVLPDSAGCQPLGVSKPIDHDPTDSLAAPAPARPYATELSEFAGSDPNGEWQLYVQDDSPGETGWVSNSAEPFEVRLTTRPRASVGWTTASLALPEGQTRGVKLTRSATSAVGPGSVRVTAAPGTATAGRDFRPVSTVVSFAAGETEKTVPVSALTDGAAEPAETFSLTVDTPTGDAAIGTPSRVDVTIPATAATPRGRDGAPGSDRTAPAIGTVRLKPSRFAIGRGKRRGTRIRYGLSERARVTLSVQRRAGRRWVRAATLRQAGRAGVNSKRFTGRVGRTALRRGRYRLVVSAVDAAGNRAKAKPSRFRIVTR